jgi:hypothetical protein
MGYAIHCSLRIYEIIPLITIRKKPQAQLQTA